MAYKTKTISVLRRKSNKIYIDFPFSILTGEDFDDQNEETSFLRYLISQFEGHGIKKIKRERQRLILVLYKENETFDHSKILMHVLEVLTKILNNQTNLDIKFKELSEIGSISSLDEVTFEEELEHFIQEAEYKAKEAASETIYITE